MNGGKIPNWLRLNEGEECYGIYTNSHNSKSDIIVSNEGLHITSNAIEERFIPYNQISSVMTNQDKHSANELLVKLKDQTQISISVKGVHESGGEIFELPLTPL